MSHMCFFITSPTSFFSLKVVKIFFPGIYEFVLLMGNGKSV